MDGEQFMATGYYWLHQSGEEPEVVLIEGRKMYRAGSDVTCVFVDGKWSEFGTHIDIVSLTGPLTPHVG